MRDMEFVCVFEKKRVGENMNIEFNHRKHCIRQLPSGVIILEERQDSGNYQEIHSEYYSKQLTRSEQYQLGRFWVRLEEDKR